MNIICVYDLSGPKIIKAMNILRKYLFHIQNSVFQGVLTESIFLKLQQELSGLDLNEDDQILFFFTYRDAQIYQKALGCPVRKRNII